MWLTLLASAIAVIAILRGRRLAAEVRALRNERDELRAAVAEQKKRGEQLPAPSPEGAFGVERAAAPTAPQAIASISPSVPAVQPETPGPTVEVGPPAPPLEPVAPPPQIAEPPPSGDWESFLGVKGAAWVAGIAFILSAIFFARWTIDEGLLTPGVGLALMLATGIGALALAEMALRRNLPRLMNPVSGAGIAILYVAFFAAQPRYALLSIPATFAALFAVTLVGGLLAARYRASAPAVLSVFGGFAACLAFLGGEEGTLPVFTFALLLDIGVLVLVLKRRWFGLLGPSLALTLALQIHWFWSFISPRNMGTGVAIALVLGVFYLALPIAGKDEDRPKLRRVSALGGLAPFLFAFALATSKTYVDQWPLLFLMIAVLDAATLIVAIFFRRGPLLLSAAVATTLTLAWWALQGLKADSGASLFGSTLFAIAIVSMFGLARRLAYRHGRANADELRILEAAALAAGAGLVLFGTVMVGYGRGAPVGPFLCIATTLVLILIEVSGHDGRLRGALALGTLGLAALTQIWFLSAVNANTLLFYLAGPVVVSLFLSFLARRKAGQTIDLEAEIAVQASGWISITGLFLALVASDRTSTGWPLFLPLASTGWPLFLGFALQVGLVIASVLRSNWTVELPALLGASALYLSLWQRSYLTADQHGMALGFGVSLYLCFLLLPLIVPFSRWKDVPLPWVASAISGPVFFFPLRDLYRSALGGTAIGLLPLALAALTGASLLAVSRRFVATEGDARGALLRLRHLALFSLVAFWFLAMAIRLQFDRQWITLGWAFEAVAVCWLFGRLPHPGLPAFAGILFALVGARLLFNPSVLEYEARGLPVFNWILYTYGIVALCAWFAQSLLRGSSTDRWVRYLADAISLTGLLLGFWLVNLEILDYFSEGAHITLSGHSGYAVKLAFSVGWGVYAVALLGAGVARNLRPIRYLSLAFMILTVGKVFLYDLAALSGIFQVLSFLGLAAGLILVSFFYQRFVFRKTS